MLRTAVARFMADAFIKGAETSPTNNTRVTIHELTSGAGYVTHYYLYFSRIAWRNEHGDIFLTLSGRATPTTRDRLNALCDALRLDERFSQRRGEQYFGDKVVGADQIIAVHIGTLSRMIFDLERAQAQDLAA